MSKEVLIVGGGIIGLCCAYYLQKEGHQVSIVDQSNLDSGASYVNAGYLSPSHIIPLSAPGVMKKGLKWMFNSSSPFYLKPRLERDFLRWLWAFNKSCNKKHVDKAIPAIKNISVLSQELWDDIKHAEKLKFHYEKRGLFMFCQTDKVLDSEIKTAQIAKKNGLEAKEVNLNEIQKLEPNVRVNVKGAIYYGCDFHVTPDELMQDMKLFLKASGVHFFTNEKVEDIQVKDDRIQAIITDKQVLKADEFVLAAGSWSGLLSKKLRLNLLLQAGKGYCINTKRDTGISIPAILAEAKVAVTPMRGFTRFSGTMEIAGISDTVNKVRVGAIAKAVSQYYPGIEISKDEKANAASGLRPVSPDGLPYIGKSKKCENLTIATGHAMMGLSMSTATGKLVSELISNKKTSLDVSPFHPDRTF